MQFIIAAGAPGSLILLAVLIVVLVFGLVARAKQPRRRR